MEVVVKGEFKCEGDAGESCRHFVQSDDDSIAFDVHNEELLQMPKLQQRARFERYIGKHLIGEDNISDF